MTYTDAGLSLHIRKLIKMPFECSPVVARTWQNRGVNREKRLSICNNRLSFDSTYFYFFPFQRRKGQNRKSQMLKGGDEEGAASKRLRGGLTYAVLLTSTAAPPLLRIQLLPPPPSYNLISSRTSRPSISLTFYCWNLLTTPSFQSSGPPFRPSRLFVHPAGQKETRPIYGTGHDAASLSLWW